MTFLLLAGLWTVQFVFLTGLPIILHNTSEGLDPALRRAVVCLLGGLLCWALTLTFTRIAAHSFLYRVVWGLAAGIVAAAIHSAVNVLIFYVIWPSPQWLLDGGATSSAYVESVHYWLWFFLAWSAIYLALSYHWDVSDRDRRLAASRAAAQRAQLRALRYQINPHFLFNTLNSLSSLILDRHNDAAEAMVLKLSDFFRASLASDPSDDISLAREIALQQLYLDIEQVRYGAKMAVVVDIPAELDGALVPSLILQPLVENSVRHGVAHAHGLTTIHIAASRAADTLVLEVADESTAAPSPAAGCTESHAGVGLANVRERLTARFGVATVAAGPTARGYRTRIELPLRFAA